jgi:hypothetical protein
MVQKILHRSDIKPHKIKYYCERRDPNFESKMHDVLLVYKQVSMQFDEDGNIIIPVDEPMVHTVSCDEKPGIQAIATTGDDLRPTVIAAGYDAAAPLPALLPERPETGGFYAAVYERLSPFPRIRETPDHGIDGGSMAIVRRDHGRDVRRPHFTFCFEGAPHLGDHPRGEGGGLCAVNIRP